MEITDEIKNEEYSEEKHTKKQLKQAAVTLS